MLIDRLRKKHKVISHKKFEGVATIKVEEVDYEFVDKEPSKIINFRVRESDGNGRVKTTYDFAFGQVKRWDTISEQRTQSIDEILIKEAQGHEIYVNGEYILRSRRKKMLGWMGSEGYESIYKGTIKVNNDEYFFMINTKEHAWDDILVRTA